MMLQSPNVISVNCTRLLLKLHLLATLQPRPTHGRMLRGRPQASLRRLR